MQPCGFFVAKEKRDLRNLLHLLLQDKLQDKFFASRVCIISEESLVIVLTTFRFAIIASFRVLQFLNKFETSEMVS